MRSPAFAIAAVFCGISSAAAQAPADSRSLADTAGLHDYIDTFVNDELSQLHVPGAVVAIVYRDKVVLLRGYGVANIETQKAVDPYRTIFRAGSVTKPFTALGIMQLMEQGRLAADVDVNRYLRDMKVPATFQQPVTVANLLTHTAGFDVALAGTAASSESQVRPLGPYLRDNLPPRVRQPGSVIAYSNHGFTLLGHIIEQISGESYASYMQRHVFQPLGMTSSSMAFTPAVEANAATGYEPRGMTGHRIAPPVHPNISPAAGLNTTAADMSKFMIAMLNGGVINGVSVLSDTSVKEMQATHFTQEPRMDGVSWGFFQSGWHNKRMVFHSGGIRGFMSAVYLWPDDRVGLFVANNGYRGDLVFDVLFHFMKRYLPAPPPVIAKTNPMTVAKLQRYAGFYRDANHTETTLEKAGGIRNDALRVRVTDRGTLNVFGVEFVETSPRFFQENNGWETLAFTEDSSGKVNGAVTTYPFPGVQMWKRVPFITTAMPSQVLMFWTLILSIGLLARPPRLGIRQSWSSTESVPASMVSWSQSMAVLMRVLAFSQLLFLILMWAGARARGGMLYGVPWQMDAAGIVAVMGALALIAVITWLVMALLRSDWPRAKLAPLIAIALSSTLFVLLQYYWNLLGIHH